MPIIGGGGIVNSSASISDGIITNSKLVNNTLLLGKMASAYIFPPISFSFAPIGDPAVTAYKLGYSDDTGKYAWIDDATNFTIFDYQNQVHTKRAITTDWAAADTILGVAIIGLYAYVFGVDTPGAYEFRVYRYLLTNIGAGGTQMTVSGTAFGTAVTSPTMNSDGTNLYFNHERGNDATNTHKVSKYSISGTTLTFVATITCGATAANLERFAVRASDGHIIGCSNPGGILRRYDTSGTLQATGAAAVSPNPQYFGLNFGGQYFYAGNSNVTTGLLWTMIIVP